MLQIKKLGVVIVLIALVTSLFVGVITNTTSTQETVTDYSFVADMSQTFNYSEEPNYTQFNPTSNYTGYLLSNETAPGVAYTESGSPSNYRMATDQSTNTNTLAMSTVTPDSTLVRAQSVAENNNIRTWLDPANPNTSGGWMDDVIFMQNPNVITLQSLIDNAVSSAPPETRRVILSFQSGETVTSFNIDRNRVVYNNLNRTMMNQLWEASGDYRDEIYGANYDWWTRTNDYIQQAGQNTNDNYPISYDIQQEAAYIYVNGTYYNINVNDTYILWKSSTGNVIHRNYNHPAGSSGTWTTETFNEDWTTNVYITYDAYQQSYIKINDGVRINNTNTSLTTNWSNSNDNSSIDIIFGKNNDYAMSNTFTLNYEGGTNRELTLSRFDNASVTLTDGMDVYNLGTWDYFLVHIDALGGQLSVYPVSSFTNYTQYTTSNTPLVLGSDSYIAIPTGVIQSISWDAVDTDENIPDGGFASFTFSVGNTVIRDSYRLLMIDPSIDINSYFTTANADGWRLNFYSFAMQGSSMSVNGQTLPVENGRITVGDWTLPLNNVYISYDKLTNHVYFTFAKERTTVDLGEWTTSVVSFNGIWFFNTSYYEAFITEQTITDIQWTKLPPMGTVALIFIAVTIILMAIGIKKIGFGLSDYIITLVSLAVALCFLEAFI